MRFIHTADVHLGACPDRGKPWSRDREKELWDSFRRLIETARSEGTELLLIAGDLFHRQPLARELKEVNALFASIPRTRVVLIAGNHDYAGGNSAYRRFSWAKNVTGLWGGSCQKASFPELGAQVYGISYQQREIDRAAYRGLRADREPGFSALMLHGEERELPLLPEQRAEMGFSYLALGHIHKSGRIGENAFYPGSLEPTDRNDLGKHGYVKGSWEDGRLSVEFVPGAVREYIPLEIRVNRDTTGYGLARTVAGETEKRGRENLYKLTLTGRRNPETVFSEELLAETCNLADFKDMTRPDYDLEELRRQYRGSLVGEYLERFADKSGAVEQAALFEGLQALMEAGA